MAFLTRFLPLLLPSLAVSQLCYWPNGNYAPEYQTCNTSASESVCCDTTGGGSTCTTNGLCIDEYGTYRRGACTDQSWKSDSCPQFCTNIVNGSSTTYTTYDNLDYCGNGDGSQFVACCGDPGNYFNCDCNNKSATFVTLDALKPYTTVLPTTATPASSGANTSTSSDTATLSGVSATRTDVASSASAVPASSTSTAAAATSSGSHLSGGAIAGIVIGVAAVLLIAIGILAYLLLRTRRRLASAVSEKNSHTSSGPPTSVNPVSTLSGSSTRKPAPVDTLGTRRTSLEMSNSSMKHELHSPPREVRHEMLSPEEDRPAPGMSWNEGEGGWMPSSDSGGGSGGGTSLGPGGTNIGPPSRV